MVESLLALDDHARSLTYGIVSSPYAVRSYRATLRALPVTAAATAETYVGWSVTFACDPADTDELTETLRTGIFTAGLRGLADHCRAR
ncbi:SRPBCC family protein [Streptomyces chrestomyceticus]|uniref:SRPBCC family protein n=1 Tax=Streptomyces chrestomyceticus TaxID=68185 RepID=UPI0037B68DC6